VETIAILGVGLIGGSFAKALRAAGFPGRILGVSSPQAERDALDLGVIDEAPGFEQAVRRADLIYLAQPVLRIIEILPALDPLVRPTALITDAGSTKVQIVQKASESIRRAQFLGGHPMAGKETRGVRAADAALFQGRTYILTPTSPRDLETEQALRLQELIRMTGATLRVLPPDEHDRVVAYLSHLPQLLSTTLASTLSQIIEPKYFPVAGPGLIDCTRLALSSYEVWKDILATNRSSIDSALSLYIEHLQQVKKNLASHDLTKTFDSAASFAADIRKQRTE